MCAQDEAQRPADEGEFAEYTLLFRAVREHALLLETSRPAGASSLEVWPAWL